MQRADQSMTAQSALVHPRIGMRANIVQREPSVAGVAHKDTAAVQVKGPHLPLRKFCCID
jgi:hypothetical protein